MSAGSVASALDALGQFAAKRRRVEKCELCSAEVGDDHPHLVDPKARKLLCTCLACALLFGSQAGAKYKRVPRRIRFLPGFRLTDAEWEGLMIPINMAFFFKSSPDGRVVAQYPSPAGATESQLSLDTWTDLVAENPVLAEMESDVLKGAVESRTRLEPQRGIFRARVLCAADRRMLQAGVADPRALAGALGRSQSVGAVGIVFWGLESPIGSVPCLS